MTLIYRYLVTEMLCRASETCGIVMNLIRVKTSVLEICSKKTLIFVTMQDAKKASVKACTLREL